MKPNYRPKKQEPCVDCTKWTKNTPGKFECVANCEELDTYRKNEKSCWTCGHFSFGCFKDGSNDLIDIEFVCDDWCEEGTKETVTYYPKTIEVIDKCADCEKKKTCLLRNENKTWLRGGIHG